MRFVIIFGPKAAVISRIYEILEKQTCNIILVGRNLETGWDSVEIFCSKRISLVSQDFDELSCLDDYDAMVEKIARKLPLNESFDCTIIYAQGLISRALFTETDPRAVESQLKVNFSMPVLSAYFLRRAAIGMKNAKWIFLSSCAVELGSPQSVLYTAAKAGLEGFVKSFNNELIDEGCGFAKIIRLTQINGGMSSDLTARQSKYLHDKFPSKYTDAESLAVLISQLIFEDEGSTKHDWLIV